VLKSCIVLICTTLFGQTPATGPDQSVSRARELILAGKYPEAIVVLDAQGASKDERLAAACMRSEVDAMVGEYAGGLQRLERVRSEGEKSALWHASIAALLAEVGRYSEAIDHNRRGLAVVPRDPRLSLQLGRVLETLERYPEAVAVYKLFDEVMVGPSLPEKVEDVTYLGRGFLRFSILTRHRELVRRTKHVLTEVFQEAFDFMDSTYWPARLAAAELLLEKHSLPEARKDFAKVLELNPRVADAMVGLGHVALEDWDFEEAEKQVKAALAVNSHHVGAQLLLADVRMTERRYKDASEAAKQALKTNPNSVEALAVLAAAQLRDGDEPASTATRGQIARLFPNSAVADYVLGRWLTAARQHVPAEALFQQAMKAAPHWTAPMTDLGQLYMEIGEETKAREMLEASFALDSFDVHTHNVLELLDSLDSFARHDTEHFIIKYDKKTDAILPELFGESLESTYDDVCDAFATKLDKRTIIEIFPDHIGFSVRVTGRPFIGTVGACSGRVIALTAPRGGPPFGQFNWADVLRHEFTHTVTLAATNNLIPHWMTEGMAVHQEPHARSWNWKLLLAQSFRQGRLFTLETIDWGFMRPRRPNDRQLAYAQSEWMIEYTIEKHGYASLLKLLEKFRGGANQARAFQDVLEVTPAEFTSSFMKWAGQNVLKWGMPTRRIRDAEVVDQQIEKSGKSAELLASLAEALLAEGELKKSMKAARDALAIEAGHEVALEALCNGCNYLLSDEEHTTDELLDEAENAARRLIKSQPKNRIALKCVALVEHGRGHDRQAEEAFLKYERAYSDDPETYRRLGGMYLERKRVDEGLSQLERLFKLTSDEPAVARQIAVIYRDKGDYRKSAYWWGRALEVDPYDAQTHEGRAQALLQAGQHAKALAAFQLLLRLRPGDAACYDGLAQANRGMGKMEEAAKMEAESAKLRSAASAPADK
jgi:tetratricopeptide (TPR) repeat protein